MHIKINFVLFIKANEYCYEYSYIRYIYLVKFNFLIKCEIKNYVMFTHTLQSV